MENVLDAIKAGIDKSVSEDKGPFFTYVIGNNGTGKSRILKNLAAHYSQESESHVQSIRCISNAVYDRFEMRSMPKVSYLGSRSVNNAVFHAAIDRELTRYIISGIVNQSKFVTRFSATIDVQISVRFSRVRKDESRTGGSLILSYIDMRKLKNTTLENKLNAAEQEILLTLIEREVILSRMTKATARILDIFLSLNPSVTVTIEKSSGKFEFKDLSSGEQNRILTAAKIMSSASRYSVVLIDEPEISLHLHWQMELHKSFKQMLGELKNYHVVVATHSPIVVSEAAKDTSTQHIVVLASPENTTSMYRTNTVDQYFDPEADVEEIFEGTVMRSNEIRSYDGLVLDFFDTATYNTHQVIEEVADLVLAAANSTTKRIGPSLDELKRLLKKKGVSRDSKQAINKAIGLITEHMG
jgi:ABC-type molybdenum transport system ATPase subunit/photorepair protein PhrA